MRCHIDNFDDMTTNLWRGWEGFIYILSKHDDTSTNTATRAAYCGSLLEGLGLSYSPLMDQARWISRFLSGSDCRSVIHYVYSSCIVESALKLTWACVSIVSKMSVLATARPFIIQGQAVTWRPRPQQVAPKWLAPFLQQTRVLMARRNK
jgi:hypothetical protein